MCLDFINLSTQTWSMLRILTLSIIGLFFCLVTSAQLIDVRSFGPTDMRQFEARMVDGQLAYMLLPAVDSNALNKVVYTNDGGDNWQELPLPNYTPTLRGSSLNVHFTSATSAILVIHDRVYHTQNAGQHWTLKLTYVPGMLVSCFHGLNGIVMAGHGGNYWVTTNGGQNWTMTTSVYIDHFAYGCKCKDDKGYLWFSIVGFEQPLLKLTFSTQAVQSEMRSGSINEIFPDANIFRSFFPVKDNDWIEGLYSFRRTINNGHTFTPITPYQPYLIQGYSLGYHQNDFQVFYSLFDSAVVIAWLDDLSLKNVIYRLPDSLKIYRGLVFGNEATQFMVTVAASEQPGANQWAVQDLKLVRRRGMLLNVAENEVQQLRIYPNPAQDRLFIGGEFRGMEEITLLDVSGRRVLQTSYTSAGLDVSQLQPGIYVLRMQDGVRTRITRFVKQ